MNKEEFENMLEESLKENLKIYVSDNTDRYDDGYHTPSSTITVLVEVYFKDKLIYTSGI